jgi:hypothetical protein
MKWTWRVWRAFDTDRVHDDRALWRALVEACKDASGRLNVAEYERWLDVLVWYRRGEA